MVFDNQLEIQRIEKSEELRKLGINPYPHFLKKDMNIKEFRDKFEYIKELDEKRVSDEVVISGRLMLKRVAGKSTFANIEDESGNVQIYYSRDSIGEDLYKVFKKNLEVGDVVLVKGFPFVTQTGEFSMHVTNLTLASKAISQLPEKFHGLVDIEMRYRQRYLDMIMNPEIRNDFKKRSKIISLIRHFFEE